MARVCAARTLSPRLAQSVTKQPRRHGWQPSTKHVSVMRGLASDLFAYGPDSDQERDVQLIEKLEKSAPAHSLTTRGRV